MRRWCHDWRLLGRPSAGVLVPVGLWPAHMCQGAVVVGPGVLLKVAVCDTGRGVSRRPAVRLRVLLGWGLVALGFFCVVGEVGDDADQVVGGGGLGGGDGVLDGPPLALAGGAEPRGPGRGQGGGDAGGGVLVVVGDGVWWG